MNRSSLIGQCMLMAASMLLVPSTSVFANPPTSAAQGGMYHRFQDFDWVKYTQQTLDDLKGKLNLKPEQMAAWDTWATGVMADANQHQEKAKAERDERASTKRAPMNETTPGRMAREIERLRTQTKWMEAHLERMDAALVRTKTFYEVLDAEQKTIFDLFWTVVHHRLYGNDRWQMPMHMFRPRMMEGDQDEKSKQ